MKEKNPNISINLLAILTAAIWGTTFASTKVLIEHGLAPAQIMFCRFVLAYIGICLIARKKLWADSLQDELWLALAGMMGGSFYFLAENSALRYTYAANVAIIIAIVPLVTAYITHIFVRSEPFRRQLLYGGAVALSGILLVVLNGHFILRISPIGDLLTLLAVIFWAFYSILLKKLRHYPSLFITRKVFFYGIITILPAFLFQPFEIDMETWKTPLVWGNMLYLGIITSLLCYLSWSFVVKRLGIVVCTNYLYLNPVAALAVSILILGEPVNPISILGAILILLGVYLSEQKKKTILNKQI